MLQLSSVPLSRSLSFQPLQEKISQISTGQTFVHTYQHTGQSFFFFKGVCSWQHGSCAYLHQFEKWKCRRLTEVQNKRTVNRQHPKTSTKMFCINILQSFSFETDEGSCWYFFQIKKSTGVQVYYLTFKICTLSVTSNAVIANSIIRGSQLGAKDVVPRTMHLQPG